MPITMYDSINIGQIPAGAQAVAGYVNGNWPTFPRLGSRFPNAHRLSIAVSSKADADCLDVEPGDATNAVAPEWVKRQHARGIRPVVYTSLSNAAALIATLAKAGIPRSSYRLWTAHYTGKAHICNASCGLGFKYNADATQYSDKALGKNLDASLCRDDFFGDTHKRIVWWQHLRADLKQQGSLRTRLAQLQKRTGLLNRLLRRK